MFNLMNENYFYKLRKRFSIKKIDSNQPKSVWIFVLTLNLIGFIGYFVLNSYGIDFNK